MSTADSTSPSPPSLAEIQECDREIVLFLGEFNTDDTSRREVAVTGTDGNDLYGEIDIEAIVAEHDGRLARIVKSTCRPHTIRLDTQPHQDLELIFDSLTILSDHPSVL